MESSYALRLLAESLSDNYENLFFSHYIVVHHKARDEVLPPTEIFAIQQIERQLLLQGPATQTSRMLFWCQVGSRFMQNDLYTSTRLSCLSMAKLPCWRFPDIKPAQED